LLGAYCSFFAT